MPNLARVHNFIGRKSKPLPGPTPVADAPGLGAYDVTVASPDPHHDGHRQDVSHLPIEDDYVSHRVIRVER
jgi:hypothetical protein